MFGLWRRGNRKPRLSAVHATFGLDGYRIGGGVEEKIGHNSFVKAEYRYSHYQHGFARHQVVGAFGFRF